MKRHLLVAAAAFTGLFMLAAVGASTSQGKTAAPAAPQASGTVTLSGWASSPTETKLLKGVIRGFEKTFPTIKVNYAPISGDYPAAMLAKFAARTPPDVFYVDSNVAPDWIKQRVLEPLDPLRREEQAQDSRRSSRACSTASRAPTGSSTASRRTGRRSAMQTNNRLLAGAGVKVAEDVGPAERGREEARSVAGGRADLPVPELGPPARVRLPERRHVPERREDEVDRQHAGSRAGRQLLRRPDQERARGDAGAARRRLVRRGARQGEGRDRLRGQLGRAVHGRQFPTVSYTNSKMVRGKQDGNLAFTVSYSMAQGLEEQGRRVAADPLPRRPAGDEDVDVEGPRAAVAERRQAGRRPRRASSPRLRPRVRGSSHRRSPR